MTSGQTIVCYGDVYLYRCLIRRIEQRPVFDPSGVNLKCWKFTIHVTGYMHGFPTACRYHEVTPSPQTAPPTVTDYSRASNAHRQVRWRLGPRQRFLLAVGCTPNITDGPAAIATGSTLLTAQPMTAVTEVADLDPEDGPRGLSYYDVDDGPRCLQFDIAHVSADSIFKVEATFEIHRVQCDDNDRSSGSLTGVLSHRWSCVDSLDVNLRTTRTYSGLLELATSQFSPHWFRTLVIPPLQPGMRREHMSFTATEDGRKLKYTVTDQSIAVSAPAPARRWNVEHTEASIGQDGLKQSSQVAITLEADENVDKGQLIVLGLYIATAKLQGSKPGQPPADNLPFVMNDVTITDFTGDLNAVRITASGFRIPGNLKDQPAAQRGVHVNATGFNKVIAAADLPEFSQPYDSKLSRGAYPDEGKTYQGPVPLAGIFRCYLQSPCENVFTLSTRVNQIPDSNPVPDDDQKASVDAIVTPSIDAAEPSYYSESHLSEMYTTFQMESLYDTTQMRAAMPIASAPHSSGGFDTSPACSIIALTRAQARRIVRMHAERAGDWPEFPNPATMDSGFATLSGAVVGQVLLRHKLLGGTVTKSCNGEDIYRARMEIVYALLRAVDPTEQLKFGINKWASAGQTVSTTTLTNSSY
jgi:hypothetical protein